MLVGASGTIGRAVAEELGRRHEVIAAGRNSGDIRLDITDESSIKAAFARRGFQPIPAARAALAYARSVEGAQTGRVFRVL